MPPIYADEMQVLGSELPVIDNLADYPTVSLQPTSTKMRRVAWRHFIKSLPKVYEISSFEVVSGHDRVSCASYLCLVDFLGKFLRKIIPKTLSS